MAISKEKKGEIVAKVKNIVDSSKSVVFVNFHKLPVSESTVVRKELRSKDVQFTVAKKTLTKRVLNDSKISGDMPELQGELALVYSADLLAPAREIYEFQKKLDGKVSILGGVFDGVFKTKSEMEAIASIPSQKTLYAQFVNIINSPIQGFVLALNAIAEKKQ
ncbi:MAG: 50S ribosomal protein L10 [Candidatus Taylorbacteria bacterium]|nr:50S ribosomal protein L10 [Candidatus Taylorbacteria bacterium]